MKYSVTDSDAVYMRASRIHLGNATLMALLLLVAATWFSPGVSAQDDGPMIATGTLTGCGAPHFTIGGAATGGLFYGGGDAVQGGFVVAGGGNGLKGGILCNDASIPVDSFVVHTLDCATGDLDMEASGGGVTLRFTGTGTCSGDGNSLIQTDIEYTSSPTPVSLIPVVDEVEHVHGALISYRFAGGVRVACLDTYQPVASSPCTLAGGAEPQLIVNLGPVPVGGPNGLFTSVVNTCEAEVTLLVFGQGFDRFQTILPC